MKNFDPDKYNTYSYIVGLKRLQRDSWWVMVQDATDAANAPHAYTLPWKAETWYRAVTHASEYLQSSLRHLGAFVGESLEWDREAELNWKIFQFDFDTKERYRSDIARLARASEEASRGDAAAMERFRGIKADMATRGYPIPWNVSLSSLVR